MTTPITPLDAARIRNAVADHAATYYGGPLGFGADDAARYVAEGHLARLVDRYGLAAVWATAREHITRNRDWLCVPTTQRKTRAAARHAMCIALAETAVTAWQSGDRRVAANLVDAGELADPDCDLGGRLTWQLLREHVTTPPLKAA